MDLNPVVQTISSSNLTVSQFRIWTGQRLNPDQPLYNMALAFFIKGRLEVETFRTAFQTLVKKSDALRTVIRENNGIPMQRSLADISYPFEVFDRSGDPDPAQAAQTWMKERATHPFDLSERLFDTALLKLQEDAYVWYLNQHHLICDGWSCVLLYRRMTQYYQYLLDNRLSEADELPHYHDYQKYEKAFRESASCREAISYWRDKTAQPPATPELYGHSPAVNATRTHRVVCEIGEERSEKLRKLASEEGIRSFSPDLSLFYIFSALLFAYIYRISGSTKLAVGTPSHNRTTAISKETIGLFIELFPLNISIASGESFRSLIKTVVPEIHNFLKYAQPGSSSSISGDVFSVVLNYINVSFSDFCGMPMHSTWIHPGYGDRGHALRLQVHDFDATGSFTLLFDFSRDILNQKLREQAVGHFLRLMDGLLENPDHRLDDVGLLSQVEQKDLVGVYNDTYTTVPEDQTVVSLIREQAVRTPDAVAITDGGRDITYEKLDRISDRITFDLQDKGIGNESMVGVFMDRSAELVVVLISIMKAGAAFVPIDSSFPKQRISYIIKDCGAQVVLTQRDLESHLPQGKAEIRVLDDLETLITGEPPAPTYHGKNAKIPAYAIYTSGSTGQPKGVVIEHRSLVNYLCWARKQYMHDGPHDFPLFSSVAADLTITSILLPLISGSKIVVYRESRDGVDLSILNVFRDDAVDIIKLTPSHLSLLEEGNIPAHRLKKLIVGGEDFKTSLARRVSGFFSGNIDIYNEYGPTEATVGCMIYRFDPDQDTGISVAIGKPIDNLRIYLLDSAMHPVPVGVAGDMYIAGTGLARGYLNQEPLTAEKFISDPFHPGEKMYHSGDLGRWQSEGVMEFLGRKDDQVKVRGFRIEKGEIEAALLQYPGIRETSVQVIDHQSQMTKIDIAYCRKCGLASNYPGAHLDNQGVCSVCRDFEPHREQAEQYFKTKQDLRKILAHARQTSQGPYDCLMQYSGGKDSTYALYQLVEMGMHPLVFSFDNEFIPESAKENIRRIVADLNLDLEWGHTPAINEILVDSLRRFSNVCNGCQKAINTMSVTLAVQNNIRYIFTGLSRGQSFETRVSALFMNDVFDIKEIDRTIIEARKAYHRMDDAVTRNLDMSAFEDDSVFENVQFVDLYRYLDVPLHELLAYLAQRTPWTRPADTGRSTNCMINEAGIYIHKKERGFHNYALPYSWDVRLGHKERDSALDELEDDIDEARVHAMLQEIGYDPEEKTYANLDRRILSYYVGDEEYTPEDLRSFLSRILPSYMIPAHFVRMDSFLLNATGKIDRSALPLPAPSRKGAACDYAAPRNKTEELLADIWSKILGVAQVGIHDNFFDLGGDSILNIQIVSRAAKAGLVFTPGLLFQHQTIADLAANIDVKNIQGIEQTPESGQVPLTPIQRWFFDLDLPRPHIWNMSLQLDVSGEVVPDILEESFHHLIDHHRALWLRFRKKGSGYEQFLGETDPEFRLETHNLSGLPLANQDQAIKRAMQKAQTSLNLQIGPILRVLFFDRGNGRANLLGIVMHHLIVDGVSWYILLDDLETTYLQLAAGKAPALPQKTTTFQQWSKKLLRYANSPEGEGESVFWKTFGRLPVAPLPRDTELPGNGTESSAETIVVQLDKKHTRDLLQKATLAGRVTVDELLLSALLPTLCRWSGSSSVRIDKEGHGREDIIEDTPLFRTVGWFTSLFPLALNLPTEPESESIIRSVKEQVRAIPNRGFGYGPLTYLNNNKTIKDTLKHITEAEILFNYLGSLNQITGQSSLFQLNGPVQGVHDPGGQRGYLLEINAFVIDEQLEVNWTFSSDCHKHETIQDLSENFLHTLQTMINYCLTLTGDAPHSPERSAAIPNTGKMQQLENVEAAYPLSPLQFGILFHALKEPDSGVYVEQYCCTLTGQFQPDIFRKAWQLVVQLHPALRTSFRWEGIEEPVQMVHHNIELDWETRNISGKSEWLKTYLQEDRTKGFSLDKSPPMRFRLFQVGEGTWQLVWSFHHIIFDGWSTSIIIKQVFEHYHHLCKGKMPQTITSRPFRDFIDWLEQQDMSRAEQFWKEELREWDEPSPLTISRFQKNRQGYDQQEIALSGQLTADLMETARSKRLTLNTIIQGVWAILLHRYSGEKDVVFGATVSGRPPSMEGVEHMIGLFINTLPVRATIEPDMPVCQWLAELMTNQARAREFDFTPLVNVQAWSELPPGVQMFDSIVVFENYPLAESVDGLNPEFQISNIRYREQSNFPLSLLSLPGNRFRMIAVYDRSLFADTRIKGMLGHLNSLLHAISVHPDQLIKELPILSPADQKLLLEWRGTAAAAITQQPVHCMFEDQVVQNPAKDAVVYRTQHATYTEINSRANQLAHCLLDKGAGCGSILGIYIDRSIEMVIAMLAVLKSGSAYVPLDPTYPPDRIAFMMTDAKIAAVLTLTRLEGMVPDTTSPVIPIDSNRLNLDQYSRSNPEHQILPDTLAYIIYTSGSTGDPKGVMINHGNLIHSIGERIRYYKNAPERYLLLSSISFDSSVAGIFGTLCRGGSLFIPDQNHYRDVRYLAGLIAKYKISHILTIPSLYQSMLEYHAEDLVSLKTIMVAGEPCMNDLVTAHQSTLPEAKLYNEYGPTEATVWSTVFDCGQPYSSDAVPIGAPINNIQVYVLDADLRQVPPGVPGELHLGGVGLSPGYLNQPEMTKERFIVNPFSNKADERLYKTGDMACFLEDGTLEFLGRNDEQIKMRGYRIELGEIEAALVSLAMVRQAVVVPRRSLGNQPAQAVTTTEQDIQTLAEYVSALGPERAEQVMAQVDGTADAEGEFTAPISGLDTDLTTRESKTWRQNHTHFSIDLNIKTDRFINPPRVKQREWLVRQLVNEFAADLDHLDHVSKKFVAGHTTNLSAFDISQSSLDNDRIMEDWQIPVMKAMARHACEAGGDLLEIGFGRGISSGFIQDFGVHSHSIIESNQNVIRQFYDPWKQQYPDRDIRLIQGRWQDVLDQLTLYDAVFFHAFPLNEEEFADYVLNSITFAEHFFPVASGLLKPGGVFTYLSTEIDSLSRRHQRALFDHFSAITIHVQPVSVPDDTIDTWWADSMVIVKAIK